MIDMKVSESEKKDMSQMSVLNDTPDYPYQLKISLNDESFKKLNIPLPQVGQKMILSAVVTVVSVEQEKYQGDKISNEVELQIIAMDLKAQSQKPPEEVIY